MFEFVIKLDKILNIRKNMNMQNADNLRMFHHLGLAVDLLSLNQSSIFHFTVSNIEGIQ